ncbi:TerD family protein [Vitreoscilla sp. C1]|uniref:TerD family protein n=1 Tax=Vitreoscilla sp. (strain C1) TaxID=96942 RepID=UPI00214F83D6|nr:TerD family protein [Vitreoscilla sp. C1]
MKGNRMQLTAGANLALPNSDVMVKIKTSVPSHLGLDITAYILDASTSKVRGDADMIFYGQTHTANKSVELQESAHKSPFETTLHVNTNLLDSSVGKIALCATLDGQANISALQDIQIELCSHNQITATALVNSASKTEKALILAEIYNHKGTWKFRFVDQGFNGGLQPLAEHFGVVIANEPTPSAPPPPVETPKPASTINLSKITLDKSRPSINLSKNDGRFGRIAINLNWNRNPENAKKPSRFNPFAKTKGIDLDLGAMIQFKNGHIDLVQALGKRFGQYNAPPLMQLQGDDRTGASSDGEWLYINGNCWDQIERIVVYTFIYEGVPNWASTDAFVTIQIPQQAPIEVQLTESSPLGTCAIVALTNTNNSIQAQREVKYFKNQEFLDQHYHFGFQWKAGSK